VLLTADPAALGCADNDADAWDRVGASLTESTVRVYRTGWGQFTGW
jgi:hypothetical protein